MKNFLLLILTLLCQPLIRAQPDPVAEIEGRLSIYLPDDTTSVHIGKNAGLSQISSSTRQNTFIGSNAGRKITDGHENSFFGANSGQNNQGGGNNSFFGANAGRKNDGTYNSFFGSNAGFENINGDENSFFGEGAGMRNTNNNGNSFFGYQAGLDNEGDHNSFFGRNAGYNNETGSANNFFGNEAGYSSLAGSYNNYFGFQAGNRDTTGTHNNFFGYKTAWNNRTGYQNTAIGSFALFKAKHKYHNVAIGDSSMYNVGDVGINAFGQNNTAVGSGSLYGDIDALSANSVAIGYHAGYEGGSNSVFIGYEAGQGATTTNDRLFISNTEGDNPLIYGEFDNQIVRVHGRFDTENGTVFMRNLGNTDTDQGIKWGESADLAAFGFTYDGEGSEDANRLHLREYIGTQTDLVTFKANGNVGIGIDDPTIKLDVAGTVRGTSVFCGAINACSDTRLKRDFSPIDSPLSKILALDGYFHYWRDEEFPEWQFNQYKHIGFKAQEIKEVLPEVVSTMPDGYLAVEYSKVVPVLVEAIKEQQAIIENQQSELDSKDRQFTSLLSRIESLEAEKESKELPLKAQVQFQPRY